jgi:hypothetical protein
LAQRLIHPALHPQATTAIAKYAFEFALLNNRKRVTAVHKVRANAGGVQ